MSTNSSPAENPQPNNNSNFPIVGIGASAGGLEAYTNLLRELPNDSGMAFVLIQHLKPDTPSMLSDILVRVTEMPVEQITDNLTVQPNHVYVIPPDKQMTISNDQLKLAPRDSAQRPFMPINLFFKCLADEYGHRAIGVVLSGLDSDGAEGLKCIKTAGGITFAQTQRTAQHSSMPNSAVATGFVDFILAPAEIAQTLADIAQHPYLNHSSLRSHMHKSEQDPSPLEPENQPLQQNSLSVIYNLLRATTGVDFTQYKRTTFERRLRRRMVLHQLNSVEEYVEYLRTDLSEIKALYHDVLITVTSFFRDPDSFAFLKESVFPTLIEQKAPNASIRIWVTGCATGEECYSLTICLLECLSAQDANLSIQVFGTDVSEEAIDIARQGIYSENQMAGVSSERRSRFFTRNEGRYQISKAVREMCVFARQNLGSDPPFSNIDLVSCRNVLIYFTPALQKRVLAIFHYALQANGFLWLGSSESVGETSELFSVVDKKHRVYSRNPVASHLSFDFVTSDYLALNPSRAPERQNMAAETSSHTNVQRQADQIVLNRYAPVGVIVSEQLEIIHFRGDTSLYVRPAPGEPSFNLLKMIRPSLLVEVRSVLEQTKTQKTITRREGLQVEGNPRYVNVEVTPIRNPLSQEFSYLLLFENGALIQSEPTRPSNEISSDQPPASGPEVERLKQELAATRQELLDTQTYLQATVEEQEAINQRLTTANEEILSSNEELQSTNEELQTAKEEIQAANEELKTTNEELESRNAEARLINDDLLNLLINVNIPIVMLSNDLRIRRFTPAAESLFNLIPGDIGRPISNIRLNVDVPDLEERITRVIEMLDTQEHEVQDQAGHWYRLRIRPYRTTENQIDGAVITLVDIDDIKRTMRQLELSRLYAESIVQTVREPLVVLSRELRIKTANRAFYELFQLTEPEVEERLFFDIDSGQWDITDLRSRLENFLAHPELLHNFEFSHDFVRLGTRYILINAREIEQPFGEQLILLAIEDITERKQAETERIQLVQEQIARAEAEAANASKDEFLSVLSHELRTPLNSILGWTTILQRKPFSEITPELLTQALNSIERGTHSQTRIISDLLEVSSIIQGKLSLQRQAVNLTDLLNLVIDTIQPMAEAKNIQINRTLFDSPQRLNVDPDRMQQVFLNGLSNAIKFTPPGGQVSVDLTYTNNQAQIDITDTGDGIDPEFLPYVFDRFRQADISNIRRYGGLGLGLAIVKYFTEAHHGTVAITSPGIDQGSTLMITLPLTMTQAPSVESADVLPYSDTTDPDFSNLRILIVEDDEDSLQILQLTLQMQDATVFTATSVRHAMNKFTEEVPDLLISDISLPDQDGFALIRWIRDLPPEQGGNVPAIALTGYAATSDTQRCIEAGFQRHIAKPFDIEMLVSAIASLFSG
ncbi:MAG: chemotaxis protein CheB [Thainema sp.]